MKLRLFIIILPFLCWWGEAGAQVPEGPSSMPEQWQLTLDVIKSKAQSLVIENNGLQVEYRKLIEQAQELQQSIGKQQNKNEQTELFLKQRHGQTDQQVRILELTQSIKTKRSQKGRTDDEQWGILKRRQTDIDHKNQLLKYAIRTAQLHQQGDQPQAQPSQNIADSSFDGQLIQLRKQLEDESTQEVLLENEWGVLKTGGKTKNMNVDAIDAENKQLEVRMDMLKLQKLQHEKESSGAPVSQANARRYDQLKNRKAQLEAEIYAYELRMDQLRQSSLTAMSWPLKKKNLVHAMVLTDARNNQMRNRIKELHEDIDILRDQTAKLERRVDFAQGKGVMQ